LCIRMPCASRMPILPPHSPLPVLPKAGTLLNCAKRAALLPDAATLQKATLQTSPSPTPKAKSAVPPGQQTPQGFVTSGQRSLRFTGRSVHPGVITSLHNITTHTTIKHKPSSHRLLRYSTLQYATVRYSTLQYATVRYSTLQYLLPLPRLLQYLLITRRSLQERTLSSIYKHLSPSLARSH
jgi:hypothetical protein